MKSSLRRIDSKPRSRKAGLMEAICERKNMKSAIRRVIKNKGAPGVDGMTVHKIKRYLKRHWTKIEKALLGGTYTPMPVRRKEIPKPGGVRLLGIPTVLDRVIQSASGGPRFLTESGIIPSASIALGSARSAHSMTLLANTVNMCNPVCGM